MQIHLSRNNQLGCELLEFKASPLSKTTRIYHVDLQAGNSRMSLNPAVTESRP